MGDVPTARRNPSLVDIVTWGRSVSADSITPRPAISLLAVGALPRCRAPSMVAAPDHDFSTTAPLIMRRITHGSVLVLLVVASACAGRASAPSAPSVDPVARLTEGFDANVRRDVETLRSATSKFHDLTAAETAGYPTKMPMCVADSTMGGMGHHLIDRQLVDDKLEIERPEMLIYAPSGEGKVELVGVEYIVPYRFLPSTEKPPRLFGQELKRYDQYNYWELHVWAWRHNAAGLFADWNPAVKC